MVAFIGFYESPRPPSSGNECGIAPSYRHGNQNDATEVFSFVVVAFFARHNHG